MFNNLKLKENEKCIEGLFLKIKNHNIYFL